MNTETTTQYTPYGIAKLLNTVLSENDIDRTVPPQMLYNYGKNGMIDKVKRASMKNVTYSETDVQEWIIKYVKKNYDIEVSFDTQTEETDVVEECEGQEELFTV